MNRALQSLLYAAILLSSACGPSDNPVPVEPVVPAATPAQAAPPDANQNKPKPETPTLIVDTVDGGKFDLKEHRGKWVIVNYWATWCNPCLKEVPDLKAFANSRDDVELVGLAYEEIDKQEMLDFLAAHAMDYPIAVIDVYTPPADFDMPRGLPMTYLIAPDGKVAKQFLGPITSEELAKVILAYDQGESAEPT
jgi:thiol-disulfide isomerase/thioredoxin